MNPSSRYSGEDVGLGFFFGLGAAISTAFWSRSVLTKYIGKRVNGVVINGLSGFAACSTGNALDILCLRNRDLFNGIPVYHPET